MRVTNRFFHFCVLVLVLSTNVYAKQTWTSNIESYLMSWDGETTEYEICVDLRRQFERLYLDSVDHERIKVDYTGLSSPIKNERGMYYCYVEFFYEARKDIYIDDLRNFVLANQNHQIGQQVHYISKVLLAKLQGKLILGVVQRFPFFDMVNSSREFAKEYPTRSLALDAVDQIEKTRNDFAGVLETAALFFDSAYTDDLSSKYLPISNTAAFQYKIEYLLENQEIYPKGQLTPMKYFMCNGSPECRFRP